MSHLATYLLIALLAFCQSASAQACGTGAAADCSAIDDEDAAETAVQLLQTDATIHGVQMDRASGSLSMAYLPYNFGHTVSKLALENGIEWGDCAERTDPSQPYEGTCLGHMKNEATGCELMYTPGKYWPQDLAEQYFGNKTIFGIFRDPYERIMSQFRGSGAAEYPELHAACDVNNGVKALMRDIIAGNEFANNCNYLPQAEFFDAPFGVTVAIDNRFFPDSMNSFLDSQGYEALHIADEEVNHISGCNDNWVGDLDCEARGLVYQHFKRDFDLACEQFGYCNTSENICLTRIHEMCPETLFAWNEEQWQYEPLDQVQLNAVSSTACTATELNVQS